jgi:hypothetical protein
MIASARGNDTCYHYLGASPKTPRLRSTRYFSVDWLITFCSLLGEATILFFGSARSKSAEDFAAIKSKLEVS